MGLFEVLCVESRLVLHGLSRLVVVAEEAPGRYQPIALPLVGSYDRTGRIDLPARLDEAALALERFLRTCDGAAPNDTLEELLRDIGVPRSAGAPVQLNFEWAARMRCKISFTLFDDGVYDAIGRTVAQGGRREWDFYAEGALERQDFDALFAAALPITQVSRDIYQPMTAQLRAALVQPLVHLARFRAWGGSFAPPDPNEARQFSGYSEEQNPGYGAEPYVIAAREKYAGFPLILDAIRANEQAWREFGAEYD